MKMQELSQFHKNDKVRIKDYVDPMIYEGMTTLHNEGWIRGVREDRWGLPMVLIEWDKNHWSYNGAPDGWTFAEHFEKVESTMTEQEKEQTKNDKVKSVIANFAQQLVAAMEGEENTPEITSDVVGRIDAISDVEAALTGSEEDAVEQRLMEAIDTVVDKLVDTEAFIVIGVERLPDDRAPKGAIVPFTYKFSITPDAELVANTFLSTLAAEAHHDLALKSLLDLYQDEIDEQETKK